MENEAISQEDELLLSPKFYNRQMRTEPIPKMNFNIEETSKWLKNNLNTSKKLKMIDWLTYGEWLSQIK